MSNYKGYLKDKDGNKLYSDNMLIVQQGGIADVTYQTTASWTWLPVSNTITINESGLYLLLFTGWVMAHLGSEMDLRFTRNDTILMPAGQAVGNNGIAIYIQHFDKGDTTYVSMQTSNAGTSTITNQNFWAIKIGI